MPALSRLNCSSLPSRYQEGLKKTKELQDLKEEEEERKRENPEEPEETELEEDEKDERRRLESLPLLKWFIIHLTVQHPWAVPVKDSSGSGAQKSSQEKQRGRGKRQNS